jgi:hypothetical protein
MQVLEITKNIINKPVFDEVYVSFPQRRGKPFAIPSGPLKYGQAF